MIKTIIFDFDDTIVCDSKKEGDSRLYDRIQFERFFKEDGLYDYINSKYHIDQKDTKDLVDVCRIEGLDYKGFATFYNKHIYMHKQGEGFKVLPDKFFQKLKINHSVYIISMSNGYQLRHHMKNLNLNILNFKDIISMDLVNDRSKADKFKLVMKRENCKPEEMLMIGDNFFHDVQPALELGMNALHFNGDFNQIYDYFTENKICNCKEFKEKKKFVTSKNQII